MKVKTMRKNDILEDYINQNRSEFDNAFPSLKIWASIENELNGNPNEGGGSGKKYSLLLGLIGLVIILAGSAYFILDNKEEKPKEMLFAEVEDLEHFYELQSNRMIKSVSNDFSILQNPDLLDIENHITEIKQDLGEIPKGSEEKALKALLESYRTKLMIIERILEHHEISQPSKNNNNEYNI